jgi:predicted thioesterase
MKSALQPGIEHELTFTITSAKRVPALYPESIEFQAMPDVFATGYMKHIAPHDGRDLAAAFRVNPSSAGPP